MKQNSGNECDMARRATYSRVKFTHVANSNDCCVCSNGIAWNTLCAMPSLASNLHAKADDGTQAAKTLSDSTRTYGVRTAVNTLRELFTLAQLML